MTTTRAEPKSAVRLVATGLAKSFTLHTQGGVRIPVFESLDMQLESGSCVVLTGPSGIGKSSLLRTLYANYLPTAGVVRLLHDGQWVELTHALPRIVLDIRRRTLGFVSQFLRVIPRVPADETVAAPLLEDGVPREQALAHARSMLERLNLPERLWRVPPATFSGGEQQRVALARALVLDPALLLLDEPLAALDATRRRAVRRFLAERLEAFGRPSILVTHDVRDVIALEATVVALDSGRVIQRGSLDELRRSPASDFIAEFVGAA